MMASIRRRMKRRAPLISLEEERPANRTNCFVPPDGGHVCRIVTANADGAGNLTPGREFECRSRADVSHVEVDHVLGVGALDRDGERLEGVESEGDQAPHGVVYGPSQQAGLDLKLQQAGVPSVKPGRREAQ